MESIFLTYNSGNLTEQGVALRLQTIASIYGLRVEIPDRLGVGHKENTKQRIERCKYVVAFPFGKTSKVMLDELKYAQSLGKKIIVVYHPSHGKKLAFANQTNVVETWLKEGPEGQEEVLRQITENIANSRSPKKRSVENELDDTEKSLLAFLGIGLGIVLLTALFKK